MSSLTRYSICIVGSLILLGCSRSNPQSTTQQVVYEPFVFQISSDFQEIPSELIENKQILNKVHKSFKLPTESGFTPSLLVTSTPVGSSVDIETFWTANNNKLKQQLQNYQVVDKQVVTFSCNKEKIKGIQTHFLVEHLAGSQGIYEIKQYQYIYEDRGYLISYAIKQSEETDTVLSDILETLTCTQE